MEYYCSWSGGVDSTATGILAVLHQEPLTAMVYARVMFDKHIPADLPEHDKFIQQTAIPWFARHGVQVIVVQADKNFVDDFFYHQKGQRSKYPGKYLGFPMMGRGLCGFKLDTKLKPLWDFFEEHPGQQYMGYAADEDERLEAMKPGEISLLQKYEVTHSGARELCKEYGLLSPYYQYSTRGGCFFCPNASDEQLRHIRDHHPQLWARLLELQKEPNIVRPGKFRIDEGLGDIEARFAFYDAHISIDEYLEVLKEG